MLQKSFGERYDHKLPSETICHTCKDDGKEIFKNEISKFQNFFSKNPKKYGFFKTLYNHRKHT